MDETSLDRIHIRDLLVRCIVGLYDEERREKQDVVFNLTLYADLSKAGQSDKIEDTVDYKVIKKNILDMARKSDSYLIEHLAESAAEIALNAPGVLRVDVVVDKPGALSFTRSVAVEITRRRK